MWNRNESESTTPSTSTPSPSTDAAPPSAAGSGSRRSNAVIGPSITIKGDLFGEEDLVIEGKVEGGVQLKQNRVVIGQGGQVKADVSGKEIHVEGQVDGNLIGEQEVVIRKTGRVVGNITAPRVTLEDGCKLRGNVDMSPRSGRNAKAGPIASAAAGTTATMAKR